MHEVAARSLTDHMPLGEPRQQPYSPRLRAFSYLENARGEYFEQPRP